MSTETLHPQALPWSDALHTGDARMDDTHQEFVQQLNALLTLPPEAQLAPYRAFVQHTREHFAQEERWLKAIGFAAENCHASHHATILETLDAVEQHFVQGDEDIITRMAEALAEWFPQHAATMDAGLAQAMREMGFDSRSETLLDPTRQPEGVGSHGCGSRGCA